MNPADFGELLRFATRIAQEAGELTLEYFNKGVKAERKADDSPVTIADRGAEELLRKRIEAAHPLHGILGEEFGETTGKEGARWILDPIDGTVSFVCGVPMYCVLVGLEWQGEMVIGVIHMPALGETVAAARGLGCTWNGRPCRVSKVAAISQATVLSCGIKHMRKFGREDAYRRLCGACRTERGWCDGYAYALVATGRADISVDPIMNIWDTAALLPVITEAGGRFSDWNGRATHAAPDCIATNGMLHDEVLACLGGATG